MACDVGARLVNGDLCLGPEVRFVSPPRKKVISLLPPFKPLAKTMNMVATHLPSRLLRPIILSFLTTYLAPSPKLFHEGAILVNKEGRAEIRPVEVGPWRGEDWLITSVHFFRTAEEAASAVPSET